MSQTFWTVIAGVTIFVVGQVFIAFILKPLQDFLNVIGQISHKVKFHSNVLTSSGLPQSLVEWASGDMRDLSSQLESRYILILFSSLLSRLRIIPEKSDVRKAASILIFLSNSGGQRGAEVKNGKEIDKLKKYLNIDL